LSVASLANCYESYVVLPIGACMALKRGPMLVWRKGALIKKVGVSGFSTSSYVAVRVFAEGYNWEYQEYAFDKVLGKVVCGEVDAGVIISEDQLRVNEDQFEVVDLGSWWYEKNNLALPLGIDVIKGSLSMDVKKKVVGIFRDSIEYGLNNLDSAMDYAMKFSRGLSREKAEKFVLTYVNGYSLGRGEDFYEAIDFFLDEAKRLGIFSENLKVEYFYEDK
ncbi:MAG: MqnA/MqnD/SBP family protein, partial [Lentisphaeria bacterium]